MSNSANNSVSWSEARAAVVSAILTHAHRDSETVTVAKAIGRFLASPVLAPMDIPHYTSSAMDGFAVRGSGPWRLLAAPASGAGGRNVHRIEGALEHGEALPVLTGSLLPVGTESVIRSENAEVSCDGSTLHASTPPVGKDIRPSGEERRAESEILTAGTRITPRHAALLSASGVDTVEVARRPTVACAFTGNEVVCSGLPEPGEVRDAFSVSFPALLEEWGAQVISSEPVPDDPVAVEYWLRQPTTTNADIVLATGGSGHSSQDLARRFILRAVAAAHSDGEVLASEVACRPGHPTLLARRGSQIIIGAPGNPFAAHVALHSFVAPAVATFVHGASTALTTDSGVCSTKIAPLDREHLRLIPAQRTAEGKYIPAPGAHSHMLTGYATGDALLIVPSAGLAADDPVALLNLSQTH